MLVICQIAVRSRAADRTALSAWKERRKPLIMAVAARFSTDSEGLATAPHRYALIFERTDDGSGRPMVHGVPGHHETPP
jgi:hypothetical protein